MRKRPHSGGMNRHRQQKHGRYNNNQQRPRKNFRALQEKYLNLAKDAMGSGDRILAEYYLQHADHYFRMQAESMEERNRWQEQRARNPKQSGDDSNNDSENDNESDSDSDEEEDVDFSGSSGILPSFITRKTNNRSENNNRKNPPTQDWEDRDAD